MKKMLLKLLRWPCLLQDALNRTFTVQNKPAAETKRKPSPIISSFLELGRRNCRCSQNLWRRRNAFKLKTETQQTFVNGIARFYYFRHLPAGSARVLLINCMSCSSIWATPSALINILLGSFPVVFNSDQPSGEIILFSGARCFQRLHYPRRRRWWLHALTDRPL